MKCENNECWKAVDAKEDILDTIRTNIKYNDRIMSDMCDQLSSELNILIDEADDAIDVTYVDSELSREVTGMNIVDIINMTTNGECKSGIKSKLFKIVAFIRDRKMINSANIIES